MIVVVVVDLVVVVVVVELVVVAVGTQGLCSLPSDSSASFALCLTKR
jgi:hypothetical protein